MILEVWDNILNNISDVEDICNCRLVCKDFKDLIERTEKMENKNINKNINISFIHLFPRLKHLKIPIQISTIYLLKNLRTITFYSEQENLMQYISSIEDLLFPLSPHYINEKKIIKIYTEKAIYWLSQYKYGRYAEFEYNDIDEYMRDATRCKTFISNKKPFQYFPITNFIYVCPTKQFSGFDYYPSNTLKKYTWQPVVESMGKDIVDHFKYLEYLSDFVLEIDRTDSMVTYEIPILEKDLPELKAAMPNLKNYAILKADSIVYSDHITYFHNLPLPEVFIDSVFK
jgi:hypothetical protein